MSDDSHAARIAAQLALADEEAVNSPNETEHWVTKPGEEIHGLRVADCGGSVSIDTVDPDGTVRESVLLNTESELDDLITALEQVAEGGDQ